MKTLPSYNLAVVCWLVVGFSKQILLPVMAIALVYLFAQQAKKRQAMVWSIALFLAFAIPAGLHTLKGAYIFSPFGYSGRELINHDSGHTVYELELYDQDGRRWNYHWSSASFYINPLAPLVNYTSYRDKTTPYRAAPINLNDGRKAWNEAIAAAAAQHSLADNIMDLKDNFIYLFFGPSWPDSDEHSKYLMRSLDFHIRWLWPLCLLTVLGLAPVSRMPPEKMLIVFVSFSMTLLLLFQQSGVMEGRYRKPIEPFLLLSTAFLLSSFYSKRNQAGAVSLVGFLKQCSIPIVNFVAAEVAWLQGRFAFVGFVIHNWKRLLHRKSDFSDE